MKIIVRQLSGLGNQMFQYAAGLYYAKQLNAEMRMAVDPPQKAHSYGHPRPFLLSHFCLSAPHRELGRLEQLLLLTNHRRLSPVAGPLLHGGVYRHVLGLQIISESVAQRFHFQPTLSVHAEVRTAYLLGYWQVHNIADRMAPELRSEFAFMEAPAGKNLEALRLIGNTENSVSLHIRRGDYTLEAEGNIALPMGYYNQAINILNSTLNKPTFFVFSDDIGFARRNLQKGLSVVYMDHNDSFSAHEDLRLMSACRHHIIANSTFSWWGAWLNQCTDKIVLAPRQWRVGGCPDVSDLLPPGWRLLDVAR